MVILVTNFMLLCQQKHERCLKTINMIICLYDLKLHTLINKINIACEYGVTPNFTIFGLPQIRFVLRRHGSTSQILNSYSTSTRQHHIML